MDLQLPSEQKLSTQRNMQNIIFYYFIEVMARYQKGLILLSDGPGTRIVRDLVDSPAEVWAPRGRSAHPVFSGGGL
jgi:hypothetical protein